MKKYFLSLLSWVLPIFLFSQVYEIQYSQPQIFTKSGEEGFSRFSTLKIKQEKSIFIIHGTAGFDAMDEERQEVTLISPEPDRWYFIDKSKNVLNSFEQTMTGNSFLVNELIPDIQWKITAVEKSIGGFLCKQAFTTFRGREYEAWYAVMLPSSAGPWKLQGLPGLILEANDKENEVVFKFYSFQILMDPNLRIDIPNEEARSITWDTFFINQYKDGEKFYQFISDKIQRSMERSGQGNIQMKQTGEPRFWERKNPK